MSQWNKLVKKKCLRRRSYWFEIANVCHKNFSLSDKLSIKAKENTTKRTSLEVTVEHLTLTKLILITYFKKGLDLYMHTFKNHCKV